MRPSRLRLKQYPQRSGCWPHHYHMQPRWRLTETQVHEETACIDVSFCRLVTVRVVSGEPRFIMNMEQQRSAICQGRERRGTVIRNWLSHIGLDYFFFGQVVREQTHLFERGAGRIGPEKCNCWAASDDAGRERDAFNEDSGIAECASDRRSRLRAYSTIRKRARRSSGLQVRMNLPRSRCRHPPRRPT